MNGPYSLLETRVLCKGREDLHHAEVRTVITNSMRRKMRLAGYDSEFWRELDEKGESILTWNFTRHNTANEKEWISFQAWRDSASYHLYCVGPQAEYAIDRVNKAITDKTPKWLRKQLQGKVSHSKGRRRGKKKRPRKPQTPKKPKTKKVRAVSSHVLENLTPQFRKSRIFWNEALNATVAIFQIRRDGKNTAREIAARVLWRSLEHTDYRFAQFRQDGFCLQFNIADGRWRGIDLTAVSVSCTKDNRNPVYRRMRKWMRRTLHGLPPTVQQVRRDVLWAGESAA